MEMIRELTDSELDLASGGTSNFVATVQSVTAIALDGLAAAARAREIETDGMAAYQRNHQPH